MLLTIDELIGRAKGIQMDPSFIYIDSVVNKNHNIVSNYINSQNFAVSTNHILVKILYSLAINSNATDVDIYSNVYSKTESLASSMNMTCFSRVGMPTTKQFMNGGTEYVMASKDAFDMSVPWSQLEPIKFMYHTHTNVNFKFGRSLVDDTADAFISINIPMLAVQYANWRRYAARNNNAENILNFIVKYPMCNALKSYTDISQFNRHYYRLTGKSIPMEEKFGPIMINNVESLLDKSNFHIINSLAKSSTSIGQALLTIPTFFHKSLFDIINFPSSNSRQNGWMTTCAQIPYIDFALRVNDTRGGGLDNKLLSTMERDLTALKVSNILASIKRPYSTSLQENYVEMLYNHIKEIMSA